MAKAKRISYETRALMRNLLGTERTYMQKLALLDKALTDAEQRVLAAGDDMSRDIQAMAYELSSDG